VYEVLKTAAMLTLLQDLLYVPYLFIADEGWVSSAAAPLWVDFAGWHALDAARVEHGVHPAAGW